MIRGIGVDVVEIARIEDTLARTGIGFAERVLAPAEFALWQSAGGDVRVLAKRWAAKEAFFKACGTGMREPLTWHGLEIAHDALGAPRVEVAPKVQKWLFERKMTRWHVSISDEHTHAVAFVVLEDVLEEVHD